jgi:hypothetical protein
MKPLNLDNRPCSPTSSNCVIWQGSDIPCINLCTGDTISDVVFKLATELCAVMETLKITNYDLSCFNLTACPPDTFQELIQFLIEQICSLQGLTPTTDGTKSTCPDCVVSVATCIRTIDPTLPATMQLIDYVQMIANKICTIIDDITDLANQVTNIDARVTVLENTPPPTFTLPSILTDCTLTDGTIVGGNSYPIDQILSALVNDDIHGYCALLGATSLPADLLSAVASQCIDASSDSLANPGTPMGVEYLGSWISTPITVADAITNLWIALCDARAGITESAITVVEAGLGTEVTSATIGTTTTYTVSTLSVMLAAQTPLPSISSLTPSWGGGRLCDGDLIIMSNEIYDEDGAYNPATGIWTCPADGLYRLDFIISLTAPSPNGWLDPPTQAGSPSYTYTANSGMIIAGLVSSTACDYYTVNNFTPTVISKHATISGSVTTIISAGNTVCLKIANLTSINYTSTSGDSVKMAIQRIR